MAGIFNQEKAFHHGDTERNKELNIGVEFFVYGAFTFTIEMITQILFSL